jgi:hypothetical protein
MKVILLFLMFLILSSCGWGGGQGGSYSVSGDGSYWVGGDSGCPSRPDDVCLTKGHNMSYGEYKRERKQLISQ